MTKKYNLIILGDNGNKIRNLQFLRPVFIVCAFVCAIGLTLSGYALSHYSVLHKVSSRTHILEKELELQTEEVLHQRRQIQKFAAEINDLKGRLLALDEFEKQVREIANIDGDDSQASLLGVGGSAPDGLDIQLELEERHNQLIKDMHKQIKQLENDTATRNENFLHLIEELKEQKNILAHTPAIRPAEGWTSSGFGYRQSPFTGEREFHKGIDIANRKGTPIIAPAAGTVSFVGKKGGLGKLMVIDHGYGITTRYAHVDKTLCKQGEQVKRGQEIARIGNSGRSTGPHLHYEVWLNGVPVNPAKYIVEK